MKTIDHERQREDEDRAAAQADEIRKRWHAERDAQQALHEQRALWIQERIRWAILVGTGTAIGFLLNQCTHTERVVVKAVHPTTPIHKETEFKTRDGSPLFEYELTPGGRVCYWAPAAGNLVCLP